jgi:hypothetical protein
MRGNDPKQDGLFSYSMCPRSKEYRPTIHCDHCARWWTTFCKRCRRGLPSPTRTRVGRRYLRSDWDLESAKALHFG